MTIKTITMATLLMAGSMAPGITGLGTALGADDQPMAVLRSQYFSAEDFINRRHKLLAQLGDNDVVALLPSELDLYSNDTDFPYHAEVHVLYLTGSNMEKTHLLMTKRGEKTSETLFTMKKDPHFETYMGRIPSATENTKMSGIKKVLLTPSFKANLSSALSAIGPDGVLWLDLGNRRNMESTYPETPANELALEVKKNFPDITIKNLTPILRELREVKSDNEVEALRRASVISAKGHKAAMTRSLTATQEHQVEATLEFTFRDEGATGIGYPSIVGSHWNATILHYGTNNDPIRRDGLMLIDAAAEVEGYSADVTRTWPVDGTFSEAQADIYSMVLEAQTASMEASVKGNSYSDMVGKSYDVVSKGLLKLGLIAEEKYDQVRLYYLHGIAHGIGLDVHDPLNNKKPLMVNQVYTIEPGVYVRKDIVEDSDVFKALTPAQQKSISVALSKYNHIGVRIEDDIVITETGNENLSKDAPRTIAEIEKHLKR